MTNEAQLITAVVALFGALQAGTLAVIRYLIADNKGLKEDNEALLAEGRAALAKYQAREEEERVWRVDKDRRAREGTR